MAKKIKSARGQYVDFDLLAIKQQLASKPVPVGVMNRRKFIDEKEGVKTRQIDLTPVHEEHIDKSQKRTKKADKE